MTELINLETINTNGGSQARAALCADAVAEFAEAMQLGADFPPVILFQDGSSFWLADGFHRVTAAKQAGLDTILAEVREGTLRDAILFAVGANAEHGLRRSNADKRKAVTMLLADEQWAAKSDRAIAEQCRVSHKLVADVRAEIDTVRVGSSPNTRNDARTGRDGRQYKPKKVPKVTDQPQEERELEEPSGSEMGSATIVTGQDGDSCPLDKQAEAEPKPGIPERLKAHFDAVPLFDEATHLAGSLIKVIQKLRKTPAFLKKEKHKLKLVRIGSMRETLKRMTPSRLCPACGGQPIPDGQACKTCAGKGYLTIADEASVAKKANAGTNVASRPPTAN
jgi:hypothetical protein